MRSKKIMNVGETMDKKLWKKVGKMELGNPVLTALVGLVVFYIGLKMFAGGMKAMGNIDHLAYFTHSPLYMFISDDITVAIIITFNYSHYRLSCIWRCTIASRYSCSAWCQHRNDRYDLVSRCFCLRWYA